MNSADHYDAVLLLSFGGPEHPDEVIPFLRNVTRGKPVPPERLELVAEHYRRLGGRSPINEQNRALLAALRSEFDGRGLTEPRLYWGNRHWRPFLVDTLRTAYDDGVRRLIVILTSAYSSYSGCRQYREDLVEALAALAGEDRHLVVDTVRPYFDHPGFVAPFVDAARDGLDQVDESQRTAARIVFVAHSVPTAMNEASGVGGGVYVAQLRAIGATIAARLSKPSKPRVEWDVAYCSRSGPPTQPWLEPDINDHLRALAAKGVPAVVVVPVGFVSDHLEVLYDLDVEAQETAADLGLPFVRVPTVGTDPRFVAALADLVFEQAVVECPIDCCRTSTTATT